MERTAFYYHQHHHIFSLILSTILYSLYGQCLMMNLLHSTMKHYNKFKVGGLHWLVRLMSDYNKEKRTFWLSGNKR